MAYKYITNKISDSHLTNYNLITQLLIDAGWEVYDSDTTYMVLRSDGETPDGKYMYVRIYNNTYYFTFSTNWNTSTNAYLGGTLSSNLYSSPGLGVKLFGYANKNGFFIFQITGGTTLSSISSVIKFQEREGSFTTTVSSAVSTTGNNIVIPVTDNTNFIIGAPYAIVDIANGKNQSFICTGKGTGTITADNTNITIASGSLIGVNVYPVGVFTTSSAITAVSIHDPRITGSDISTVGAARLSEFLSAWNSADLCIDIYKHMNVGAGRIPGSTKRISNAALYETLFTAAPAFGNLQGYTDLIKVTPYWTTDMFGCTATLNNFDVQAITQLTSGTSTSSNTSTTLNDTSKTWTTNEWANKVLIITSGTAAGQIVKIISNTNTQLTTTDFSVIPGNDTYIICEEAYRVLVFSSYNNIFLREGV